MSTLIIHPEDQTTDFLELIYRDIPNKTVIRHFCEIDDLIEKIRSSSLILMLGHGTASGLICGSQYIIYNDFAQVLREKENKCIFIWCFAELFVREHSLRGIYTGMFISEVQEAELFDIRTSQTNIDESNHLFATLLGEMLSTGNTDLVHCHSYVKQKYHIVGDPVVHYNNDRWYINIIQNFPTLHDHPLYQSKAHSRDYISCDACQETSFLGYYCCEICNWDICEKCYHKLVSDWDDFGDVEITR
jgi:hypothetical protein